MGAKVLSPFAGEHDLTVPWLPDGRNVIHLDIGLPFSWKVFYLMSWAFIIGQIVYRFACPEIVRSYGTYGEYLGQKGDNRVALQEMMFRTLRQRRVSKCEEMELVALLPPLTAADCRKYGFGSFAEHFRDHLLSGKVNSADAFDVLLWIEERSVFWAFCVSGLAFLLGLFLFSYVVVENLIAVCRLL